MSPAVLFYNENTKVPGLFTQFDIVVFDEAQTLSFSSPDETVAKLKGYLEQGKYSKGKFTVSADAGAVFIANVQLPRRAYQFTPITSSANYPRFYRNRPCSTGFTASYQAGTCPGSAPTPYRKALD